MKKSNKNTVMLLSFLAVLAAPAFAQEDPLLSSTESIVSTDSLDIEGLYKKQKKKSQADKLQEYRRQLEEKHEQMMRKRVEDIRLEEERKLARKLEKALGGQLQAMDSINSSAAAPQRVSQVQAPTMEEEKNNRVSFSGGFMNLSGTEQEYDASLNLKASMESQVHPRFALGFSVRYVSLDITNERGQNGNYNSSYYNPASANNGYYYTQSSYSTYSDELKYSQMSFGLHSKFYFTVGTKIRPFAGAGVAYNRGSLKYTSDVPRYYYNTSNSEQDEKLAINNVSGSLIAGAEVRFNEMISAELSVQFDKTLTSSLKENSTDTDFYQRELERIGYELENANAVSANIGIGFNF